MGDENQKEMDHPNQIKDENAPKAGDQADGFVKSANPVQDPGPTTVQDPNDAASVDAPPVGNAPVPTDPAYEGGLPADDIELRHDHVVVEVGGTVVPILSVRHDEDNEVTVLVADVTGLNLGPVTPER